MTAREHAKLLGLFFWIYVGIQVVMMGVSLIFMTVMFGTMMTEFSKMPHRANKPNPEMFFGIIGGFMVIAVIFGILMLIPKLIAGYGLRNEKSWAKVWAIIGCCLAVLSFPFGTAIAVYGFWFIFGDMGKAYFDNNYNRVQPSPPPPNSWQ